MVTLPLVVRLMANSEISMVLSDWKKELFRERKNRGWGKGLEDRDYWALINHVLDRITLPSCAIYIGVHEKEPSTPCCWAAVRSLPPHTGSFEILFLYARQSIGHDPELAAALERSLLEKLPSGAERLRSFNPFLELRRT